MTTEELKQSYLDWIEYKTNNKFDVDNLPGGIKLALNHLTTHDPLEFNVVSEKISDMSQTFANDGGIPKIIWDWISPYKNVRW